MQASKSRKTIRAGGAPRRPARTDHHGVATKAGFVRSQPYDMPARQVVDAAARLGLLFSPDYVHKVRSATKAAIKLGAAPPSSRPMPARARAARASSSKGPRARADLAFRTLVFEIGLQRARELIGEVERKLGVLIAT